MHAHLLAVTHRIVERLGQRLQIILRHLAAVASPRRENLVHITFACCNLLLQEYRQIDLADETYSLRILALGRSELLLGRYLAHLRLLQMPYREERITQLLLRKLA